MASKVRTHTHTRGSGISWAVCKSAPCSRQITKPPPHHSVFYRSDALPAAQPTVSKQVRNLDVYLFLCLELCRRASMLPVRSSSTRSTRCVHDAAPRMNTKPVEESSLRCLSRWMVCAAACRISSVTVVKILPRKQASGRWPAKTAICR